MKMLKIKIKSKKSLFCSIVILILCSSNSFSQRDTLSNKRWEIGTDMLWLINKNSLPPYSLLLRRNIHKNQRALRLRIGIESTTKSELIPKLQLNYMIATGYEFNKEINKRMSLIYGLDIQYGRKELLNQYLIGFQNIQTPIPYPQKERTVGLSFFFGWKYRFYNNFFISSESSFSIINRKFFQPVYSSGGIVYVNGQPIGNGVTLVEQFPYVSYNIKLQPIQVLYLTYNF